MNKDIVIDEVLDYYLDETYESVSEIQKLASNVIKTIAEENIEYFGRGNRINTIYGTFLKNTKTDGLNTMKDFVENTNILITVNDRQPKDPDDENSKRDPLGSYSTDLDNEYVSQDNRSIQIYIQGFERLLDYINERIRQDGTNFDADDLYFQLFSAISGSHKGTSQQAYSTLVHELQHAYDDYRSKSKALNTKQYRKHGDKYMSNVADQQTDQRVEKFISYVNLPHEIWARFSQAMHLVSFTKHDFKNGTFEQTMIPIHDVVKDFKINFNYYNEMSDKMKRKLINKVAQFWHREQEKIK